MQAYVFQRQVEQAIGFREIGCPRSEKRKRSIPENDIPAQWQIMRLGPVLHSGSDRIEIERRRVAELQKKQKKRLPPHVRRKGIEREAEPV